MSSNFVELHRQWVFLFYFSIYILAFSNLRTPVVPSKTLIWETMTSCNALNFADNKKWNKNKIK